jgi:hypothetical protein
MNVRNLKGLKMKTKSISALLLATIMMRPAAAQLGRCARKRSFVVRLRNHVRDFTVAMTKSRNARVFGGR